MFLINGAALSKYFFKCHSTVHNKFNTFSPQILVTIFHRASPKFTNLDAANIIAVTIGLKENLFSPSSSTTYLVNYSSLLVLYFVSSQFYNFIVYSQESDNHVLKYLTLGYRFQLWISSQLKHCRQVREL